MSAGVWDVLELDYRSVSIDQVIVSLILCVCSKLSRNQSLSFSVFQSEVNIYESGMNPIYGEHYLIHG